MPTNSFNPIFIGHGSPMNAITQNAYTKFLQGYAKSIPEPKTIVVISAHWQTEGTYITGNESPKQIYDFYDFPNELYTLKYSPLGSQELANHISKTISEIKIDNKRGIDHAGWAVIKHMYPNANVPLLELSLDLNKSPEEHFQLGKELITKIDPEILFIGSGNLVHNLGDITFNEEEPPFQWAEAADTWLKDRINNNQISELLDYEHHFPDYKRSIPTNEHYIPFLYILGMHNETKSIKNIYKEIQNGSISMRSIEVMPHK